MPSGTSVDCIETELCASEIIILSIFDFFKTQLIYKP